MVVWLMEHYAQSEARALAAEEECRLLGIAQFEANAARLKAEAALRDIGRAAEDGFKGDTTADYAVCLIRNIARAALEPPP
jgi:hypothetical protein